MKTYVRGLLMGIGAVAVTVVMARGVANAYCAPILGAVDKASNSAIMCKNTGADAEWCYYDCWCSGDQTACDQMYDFFGLVDA